MELIEMKKDLQKFCKKIRINLNKGEYPYPKAMMTNKQMQLKTSTINCGSGERGVSIRNYIFNTKLFEDFIKKWNVKNIQKEKTSFGDFIIRLIY